MENVIDFPKQAGIQDLAAAKAQLANDLRAISDEMRLESDVVLSAAGVSDFAAAVHSVADKLTESSERWNALSQMIRRHDAGLTPRCGP